MKWTYSLKIQFYQKKCGLFLTTILTVIIFLLLNVPSLRANECADGLAGLDLKTRNEIKKREEADHKIFEKSFNDTLPFIINARKNLNNDVLLRLIDGASGGKVLGQIKAQMQKATWGGKLRRYEYHVELPPIADIVTYINSAIDANIASGKLKVEDALRPARVFYKKKQASTFEILRSKFSSKFREELKTKQQDESKLVFKPWSRAYDIGTLNPIRGNKNSSIFDKMLARGYYPLGEPDAILWTTKSASDGSSKEGVSQTLHDLAHFAVIVLDHPELMGPIRRNSQAILSDPKQMTRSIKGSIADRDYEEKLEFSISSIRALGPTEMLVLIKDIAPLKPFLLVPNTSSLTELNVSMVQDYLSHQTLEKKREAFEILRARFPKVADYIGGAAADAVGPAKILATKSAGLDVSIYYHFRYVEAALHALENGKSDEALLDFRLARLEVLLIQLSTITAAQWIMDIAHVNVPKESRLKQIICESGVFATHSLLYKAHCD